MKILTRALLSGGNMHLELLAGESGLDRCITHHRIQKQGLALAGYLDSLRPHRIQVLGKSELGYVARLAPTERYHSLQGLMTSEVACIVITADQEVPEELIALAQQHSLPVFRTPLNSSVAIERLQAFLQEHLSPATPRHGVLMDVFGVGILLTGQSGIGKSECALDLILRGHRLIADDTVIIKSHNGGPVGTVSPLTKHHMEVRGLGIINVKELFGAASVRDSKVIELIVELVTWEESANVTRTGLDETTATILNHDIARITLPIRPGRNLASIIEVAARNHLLKLQGHHSARRFQATLESRLSSDASLQKGLQ
ncbi:MAG: HPr(Ser) kinase/phosphatase [Myxococcota bacterium]|nr:HPr(Ser) kinase/phosphatase [Myxococcota bacterium]